MGAFQIAARAFFALDRVVFLRLPRQLRSRVYGLAHWVRGLAFVGVRRADVDLDAAMAEGPVIRKTPRSMPDWLVAEVVAIRREIDPAVPTARALRPSPLHERLPAHLGTAAAYANIANRWPWDATHLLLIPWMKVGGLEKVAKAHAWALSSNPEARVVLVSTEDESPIATSLPDGVESFPLGRHLAGLSDAHAATILTRLVIEHSPTLVHVFPSRLGWRILRESGRVLSSRTRLFASSFCEDGYDGDGVPFGYAHEGITKAIPHLACLLSDNENHLSDLAKTFGLPNDKLRVAKIPATFQDAGPSPSFGSKAVLWAGRLDRQKRPELLAEIAARMPDVRFDVYGTRVLGSKEPALKHLANLPNVRLHGEFAGFSSIPTTGCGCFVYTSRWDGLPNVILEAGTKGFPVVAPRLGGIPEIIDEDSGWLVEPGDAAAYEAAIRCSLGDVALAENKGRALAERIRRDHSWHAFHAALSSVEGYLAGN